MAPDNGYPTTCWQQGAILGNQIRLPLPENPENGDWWVSLRVFADVDNPIGSVLSVTVNNTIDEQIGLGGISVSNVKQ